ncbi:hypothetical protein ACP4OV_014677 [Aristida adscensionis]
MDGSKFDRLLLGLSTIVASSTGCCCWAAGLDAALPQMARVRQRRTGRLLQEESWSRRAGGSIRLDAMTLPISAPGAAAMEPNTQRLPLDCGMRSIIAGKKTEPALVVLPIAELMECIGGHPTRRACVSRRLLF